MRNILSPCCNDTQVHTFEDKQDAIEFQNFKSEYIGNCP